MMRTLTALAAALVPSTIGGRIEEKRQYTNPEDTDRLTLRYVRDGLKWRLRGFKSGAGDFHSLVWEQRVGTAWRIRASIGARRFRRASVDWIPSIHSLDPGTGVATIQIATKPVLVEDVDIPPDALEEAQRACPELAAQGLIRPPFRAYRSEFFWVSWDMLRHRRITVLRQSKYPGDSYDG